MAYRCNQEFDYLIYAALGCQWVYIWKSKPRNFFQFLRLSFLETECIREDESFQQCAVKEGLKWTKIGDMTSWEVLGLTRFSLSPQNIVFTDFSI